MQSSCTGLKVHKSINFVHDPATLPGKNYAWALLIDLN